MHPLVTHDKAITYIKNIDSNRHIIKFNVQNAALIYLVFSMMIDYITKIIFICHLFPNYHSVLQFRDEINHCGSSNSNNNQKRIMIN